MRADTLSARSDWEAGWRRFEQATADPAVAGALNERLDAVLALLKKRLGGTFTIAELVDAYADAERWLRDAVDERGAPGGPLSAQVIVEDAGFHLFSRGAVDHTP